MPIPDVPVLFMKPRTALNGPYPAKIPVPAIAQDGTSDYEAELSFVISRTGRDIPEEEALNYILGYTASNDVSARAQQFKNSQWCFSKGSYYVFSTFFDSFWLNNLQALMDPVLLGQSWSHQALLETHTPFTSRQFTTEKLCRTLIRGSLMKKHSALY